MEENLDRLNTHDWIPEKEKTALIMIDLQEYFREIIRPILTKIQPVLEAARKNSVPVFFTQHGHRAGQPEGILGKWWADLITEGSPAAALLPELGVTSTDIIPKDRYSAFYKTDLEERLNKRGVTDIVIGGVMTNLCCETTARDAYVRDFRVFFLADGTSTVNDDFHSATLKNLGYGFAILMTCTKLCQIIQSW